MSNQYPGQPGPSQPYGQTPQQPGNNPWGTNPGQNQGGQQQGGPQQPGQQQGGWTPSQGQYGQPASHPSANQPPPGPYQTNQPGPYQTNQPPGGMTPPPPQSPGSGYQPTQTLPAQGTGAWGAQTTTGFGQNPTPPQQPAKKSPLAKILLFGGIGVVVIALIIGGVLYYNQQQKLEEERRIAEAARVEQERQVTTASEAVTGFFEALKAGDPTKALGFSAEAPEEESPLLAPAVVKAATEAAPVEELKVEPAVVTKDAANNYTGAKVKTTYSIAGKTVEKEWTLTKDGDAWKLGKVTAPVSLGTTELDFKINGASVTGSSAEALPGKYSVTTDSQYFAFKSTSFTVTEPETAVKWIADSEPKKEAIQTVGGLAKASYEKCLSSKDDVAPDNCPNNFKLPDDVTVNKGTVKFQASGNPFANAKVSYAGENIFVVKVATKIGVTAKGKRGSTALNLSASPVSHTWDVFVHLETKQILWKRTG